MKYLLLALAMVPLLALPSFGCGKGDPGQVLCIPVGIKGDSAIPADWSYDGNPGSYDTFYLMFSSGDGVGFAVEVDPPGFISFSDVDPPHMAQVEWVVVDRGNDPFILWRDLFESSVTLYFPAPGPTEPFARVYFEGKAAEDQGLLLRVLECRSTLAAFTLKHGQEVPRGWRKVGLVSSDGSTR